jgi:hypothetical protein
MKEDRSKTKGVCVAERVPGYKLFVLAAAVGDVVVIERSHPETFANDVGVDVECVPGTRLEEAQKAFDNRSGRVVPFEVDQSFSSRRRRIDECGFLSVVDQVSCIYTYKIVSKDCK